MKDYKVMSIKLEKELREALEARIVGSGKTRNEYLRDMIREKMVIPKEEVIPQKEVIPKKVIPQEVIPKVEEKVEKESEVIDKIKDKEPLDTTGMVWDNRKKGWVKPVKTTFIEFE